MRWPSFQNVFFDCDSTLSTIEGIDVLAETAGKKWRVEVLTNAAMDGKLDLADVYGKRLQAIHPSRQQVHDIKQAYKRNIVEDAAEVVASLQELGHNVFIISGGLYEPVKEFGISLGVPEENIRAVGLRYDDLSGQWWQSQRPAGDVRYKEYIEGALTISDGKAEIVRELLATQSLNKPANHRSLLIGDGSSDLMASRNVDLFVGFGGVVTRQKVLENSPVFIHSSSLTPLLALVLGPEGLGRLTGTAYAALVTKCRQLIETGEITFNDERLNQKFQEAYQAVYSRTN